jgi:hypothetical protein
MMDYLKNKLKNDQILIKMEAKLLSIIINESIERFRKTL